jgi:hypothetical protein
LNFFHGCAQRNTVLKARIRTERITTDPMD